MEVNYSAIEKHFRLSITVLVALALATSTGCTQGYWQKVSKSNALHQVGHMIVAYIDIHQGSPPKQWNDLQEAYDVTNAGYNNFTFSELQSQVQVDFEKLNDRTGGSRIFLRLSSVSISNDLSSAEQSENQRLFESLKRHRR